MSKKPVNTREPEITGFSYDEFFQNQLALSAPLRAKLKADGKDWRFLNATAFRTNGNVHRSHWKPLILQGEDIQTFGANASGMICRGDLILGIRDKAITAAHREFLNKRNALQGQVNKDQAAQLKKSAREYGVSEQTKVLEGYDDKD